MGAADDQADAGVAVLAHVVLAQGGQAVTHQVVDMAAVVQLFVLKIFGAGLEVRHRTNTPLPCCSQYGR